MNKVYIMLLMSFSIVSMEDRSNSKISAQQKDRKRKTERNADSAINAEAIHVAKEAKREKEVELLKKEITEKNVLMASLETDFGNIVKILKDISIRQNAQIDAVLASNKHLAAIDQQLSELQKDLRSHRNETKKEIDGYTKFTMDNVITSVNPLVKLVLAGLNVNIASQQDDQSKYCQEIIKRLDDFNSSVVSITERLQRIESQTAFAMSTEAFLNSLPPLESNPGELFSES